MALDVKPKDVSTGVLAATEGIMAGVTVDAEGNPCTENAKLGKHMTAVLHALHKLEITCDAAAKVY